MMNAADERDVGSVDEGAGAGAGVEGAGAGGGDRDAARGAGDAEARATRHARAALLYSGESQGPPVDFALLQLLDLKLSESLA